MQLTTDKLVMFGTFLLFGAAMLVINFHMLDFQQQKKSLPYTKPSHEAKSYQSILPIPVSEMEGLLGACSGINDTSEAALPMLSDILGLPPDIDEFGSRSRYPAPASIVAKLIKDGIFPVKNSTDRPFTAVNFGARDGVGVGGNTDPTWELFHSQGFHGLVVEADPVFWTELNKNFKGLPVKAALKEIFPDNAVKIIKDGGLSYVDVFKIDIDSWDCSVLPEVIKQFKPAVAICEYNLYFPPPIKMMLAMGVDEYDHRRRSKIYECSLQYQADDVMQPLGYSLVQVDWQNTIYVRHDMAEKLGIGKQGVDVQAAYQQGYVRQPDRNKHIPWATDVLHFLDFRDYKAMMQAVLEWFGIPKSGKQKGVALLGCGSRLVKISEA